MEGKNKKEKQKVGKDVTENKGTFVTRSWEYVFAIF